MLIFVYGEDSFRAQEKVQVMKDTFALKFDSSGMNLAEFASNVSYGEAMQSIKSPPFLGEKRMVVIKDLLCGLKADGLKQWQEGLSSVPDSTIVILWESMEPGKLEKNKLFKAFKNEAKVHTYPFPVLIGSELSKWVTTRAQELGASFDRAALTSLVERVGSDLWQMNNEVLKLVAYAGGEIITREMVDSMVRASFEDQIFQLVDAVAQKKTTEAIRLLDEERMSGASDHYIFSMLLRQVRILLGVRSMIDTNPRVGKQEVASALKLHPFVAQKSLGQAKQFKLDDLNNTFDLLFALDHGSKTGKVDVEMAVDLVVARMLTE